DFHVTGVQTCALPIYFMMRFELGLEEPDPKRAVTSAGTIAASYVAGGLIPLSPYIALGNAYRGLIWSAVVTLAALAIFGYIKGRSEERRAGGECRCRR